jgi:hypothetical protein
MGYYARREKRKNALKRRTQLISERDPLVRFANNAKDIIVLTLAIATGLIGVSVLQRSFWAAFQKDT